MESSSLVNAKPNKSVSSDETELTACPEFAQEAEATEKELQPKGQEAQFRLLVEAVQDYAIFMLDPAGHICTWNLGAQRIKQYAAREIIGKHFSIFYPDEDKRNGKPQ